MVTVENEAWAQTKPQTTKRWQAERRQDREV